MWLVLDVGAFLASLGVSLQLYGMGEPWAMIMAAAAAIVGIYFLVEGLLDGIASVFG
jgi:hypothetical protein